MGHTAPAPAVHAAPVVQAAAPVAYAAAPVQVAPAAVQGSQYHAQDDAGQYSFGYNDGSSVKQEIKTADGVIRGAYSYVDADGIVQNVNYIADALGFRVGATNLPVHHVDAPVEAAAPVQAAAAAPVAVAPAPVTAAASPVIAPQVSYAYLPYASNYGYSVPAAAPAPVAAPVAAPVVASAPVAAAATPVDATNSQYHAQDDFGQYNYGYSDPNSVKQEVKTADGVTRGSYSYVDANGIVQTVNYISDAMGFRVAATNLPVHHVDAPAAAPVAVAAPAAAPVAVEPAAPAAAPVVSAAVSAYHAGDVIAPQVQYSYLPYAQNYAYHTTSAPVVKAAPSRPVVSVTHTAPAPAVHAAPVVQAAAPVAYAAAPVQVAPAAVQGSQYHAQDDAGQYSFGYNDGSSVKQEIKTADGVIRGAYSYVDADGIVQNVNYIADALGFRVGATNLPVHHVDAPVEAAAPVQAAAAAPV